MPADVRLKGTPLAPGVAAGRACFLQRKPAGSGLPPGVNQKQETRRLRHALQRLDRQLQALAHNTANRLGEDSAGIFHAHRMMLADESLRHRLFRAVETKGYTATRAVARELDFYRVQLGTAESAYLRQRAADIREIQQALLDCLNHAAPSRYCRDASCCSVERCSLGNDHILVGRELPASLPIETDEHTVGFIVCRGGPTSHAIILARARGRPAVGNIRDLPAAIAADARVLINGDSGEIILNPSAATLARHRPAPSGGGTIRSIDPVPGLRVMANIERVAGVHEALAARAEGIGLYRSEMEVLAEGRLAGETAQCARYREVVRRMAGRPVFIRLLDFGADKSAACLHLPREEAGAAGLRGARLLLAYPELLRDQARALARASRHGPIHVLYPMIVDLDQFLALRAVFDSFVAELRSPALLHGVLFEVPSACLQARQLLQAADFGCIGTNDLVQYLFAGDRGCGTITGNPSIEESPVLWRVIEDLSTAGREAGKPLAVCGELAGNPGFTSRILQAGITSVSTSPARIAGVRLAASRLLSPGDTAPPSG